MCFPVSETLLNVLADVDRLTFLDDDSLFLSLLCVFLLSATQWPTEPGPPAATGDESTKVQKYKVATRPRFIVCDSKAGDEINVFY